MGKGVMNSRESFQSRGLKWLLKLSGTKKFWDKSGEDLFKAIEKRRMLSDEPPRKLQKKMVISKHEMNGSYYYELRPKKATQNNPVFYIHGGAYVYRISRLHWHFLDRLLHELNCTIIVPLYPLAPEYKHEHTLRFVYDLYRRQVNEMKNPEDMILMGDSAGGGLALVLAQLLKEKQLQQPHKIILISPWLDVSLTNPAIDSIENKDPFLVRTGLIEAGKMYAGDTNTKDPKVSPIYGELHSLGDITLFMGTHDILLADARKFVGKANKEGIHVDYFEAEKMGHIYPIYNFPESKIALRQIINTIEDV